MRRSRASCAAGDRSTGAEDDEAELLGAEAGIGSCLTTGVAAAVGCSSTLDRRELLAPAVAAAGAPFDASRESRESRESRFDSRAGAADAVGAAAAAAAADGSDLITSGSSSTSVIGAGPVESRLLLLLDGPRAGDRSGDFAAVAAGIAAADDEEDEAGAALDDFALSAFALSAFSALASFFAFSFSFFLSRFGAGRPKMRANAWQCPVRAG